MFQAFSHLNSGKLLLSLSLLDKEICIPDERSLPLIFSTPTTTSDQREMIKPIEKETLSPHHFQKSRKNITKIFSSFSFI
jgi:hypothetical protein